MQDLAQLTPDGKGFNERYLWKIWKEANDPAAKREFLEDTGHNEDRST